MFWWSVLAVTGITCQPGTLFAAVATILIQRDVFHFIRYLILETNAQKRRKDYESWTIDFVDLKRAKWVPTKWSCICSNHFTQESISRRYPACTSSTSRLIKDDFGILAYICLANYAKRVTGIASQTT